MDVNIATHSREKLPGTLSYALSSTELREGLEGLPVGEIRLIFRNSPWRGQEFQRLLASGLPLPALVSVFVNWTESGPPASRSRSGSLLGEEWRVEVYGIPRSERAHFQEVLVERGIPALREWFEQDRPDSWAHNPGDRRWGKRRVISVARDAKTVSIKDYE